MVNVEFLFDFGSPNAYLAHLVIPRIEARTGVNFRYVPILLGGIFKLTNNQSPSMAFQGVRNKLEYGKLETKRFIARNDIAEFTPNPDFPVNTLQIMRGAIVAQEEDCFAQYVDAVFRHMWAEPKKMGDQAVIADALDQSGFDGRHILECCQQPGVKRKLMKNTEAAVERGVFGSPAFFVNDELFFGKDKLPDVEYEIMTLS